MKLKVTLSVLFLIVISETNAQIKSKKINSTVSANFNYLSSSENILSVLFSESSPLQYNDNLNTVSFIHRKSPTYISSPDNNSGSIVAMIGQNFGAVWDSTCLWTNSVELGRYPQGGIYNPVGNVNLNNAYIVATGPVFGNTGWEGNFYASKSLNGAGTNTPGADQQYLSDMLNSYPTNQAKHSLSRNNFVSTDDGKVRSMASMVDNINASYSATRGVMLVTGVFNAGVMVWKTDSFVPNVMVNLSGKKYISGSGYQAWNENGTVGYIVTLGVQTNASLSNRAPQPIIYKTTNSGLSWAQVNSIDFNLPAYNGVKASLCSINNNSVITKPIFREDEGVSCVVDINNKLHIVATVGSAFSNDFDSLNFANHFSTEGYGWPMTNFYYPYIYDFFGDGASAWNGNIIDSVETEGPGLSFYSYGFNSNPWDTDGSGNKVTSGMRIQASRNATGQHIIYSWAESDTNNTTNHLHWNEFPNIKLRAWDANNNKVSEEADITSTCSNIRIPNQAFFHHISPAIEATSSSSSVTFSVPVTVSNSVPLAQLSKNDHFYSTAAVNFTNYQSSPLRMGLITSVNKDPIENESINIFPNPVSRNLNIFLNTKDMIVTVSIYDANNKMVNFLTGLNVNNLILNTDDLKTGIYFIKIQTENSVYTKKIIKD